MRKAPWKPSLPWPQGFAIRIMQGLQLFKTDPCKMKFKSGVLLPSQTTCLSVRLPPIRFNMSAKKLALLERFGLELTISHKKTCKSSLVAF